MAVSLAPDDPMADVHDMSMSHDLPLDPSRVSGAPSARAVARTDIHPHVARQIAEALFQNGNKPVELTLDPEELGRVKLSIKSVEHGIVVSILADRGETLDLMRRHIDELSRDFQELGYRDIAFSFGESNHPDTGADPDNPRRHAGGESADRDGTDRTATDTIHLSTGPLGGLDLRL